jgi:hypothetical protein
VANTVLTSAILGSGLVVWVGFAHAQVTYAPDDVPAVVMPDSLVPQSAFFVGVGGGGASANFGNQNVFGRGTSFTPPTGGHTTPQSGSAAGSPSLDLDTQTALAPTVQAGYFQHFFGTPWLWGGKFSYSHLDIGSARNDLLIPQSGGFTQDGLFDPFVGNYLVQSYR